MSSQKRFFAFLEIIVLMLTLQTIRELLEKFLIRYTLDSDFNQRMATMAIMVFLTCIIVIYACFRRVKLNIFPLKFGTGYIILTCVTAVLFIATPANYIEGYRAIFLLIYGSIVTPIYEEIVFRGYIWSKLSSVFSKQTYAFIWNILFFTVWHIGYMVPQIISGNWNALLWKLVAGFCYGAVLGLIRMKAGNCYATILAHGILNLFMI